MSEAEQLNTGDAALLNSLSSLVSQLYGGGVFSQQQQLSQTDTLYINNRGYLLSNFRQLLSQLYVEHGIVQTLVDQPVDDAFRAGFEIKTSELDADDIERLQIFMERNRIVNTIMQAVKWGRLYGGGAILIITDQDPQLPFNPEKVTEKTPIIFKAIDMWELYYDSLNVDDTQIKDLDNINSDPEMYNYCGKQIHHSRIYRIAGKEAPSFIKPRLRGWGMSELERLVRSINQYMKNQNVVFDLLDEAKVDVFRMKGFNTALLNQDGSSRVADRIQKANILKNYNNALTMDSEDEYEQKQITFSGLSEVLTQIRQGLAADLKMPITKLFGVSAAGFSSGEDDIENYNSMIEGEVRSKVKYIIADILAISSRKLFGFAPQDLIINFPSLRILKATEEEEVKDKQFQRIISAYNSGLMEGKEAKEAINKGFLLPVEIDPNIEPSTPIGNNPVEDSTDNEG